MVEAGDKPLVLVTGVSGFLGAATAKEFLLTGEFRVRGTVRSTANEAKL
jgi:thioester reductase-like protein